MCELVFRQRGLIGEVLATLDALWPDRNRRLATVRSALLRRRLPILAICHGMRTRRQTTAVIGIIELQQEPRALRRLLLLVVLTAVVADGNGTTVARAVGESLLQRLADDGML